MSRMIANRFTTRAMLLRGDLSTPGFETPSTAPTMKRIPTGLPLPKGAGPRCPPPGLPLPMGVGPSRPPPGLSETGSTCPPPDSIGDTVTQLRASIVGCHRETVTREIDLDFCPSSNLHHFVKQSPHSRHDYFPPTAQSCLSQSNYT